MTDAKTTRVINIHHNDMDGWSAGAQLWQYFTDKGYEVIDIETNYGKALPILDELNSDDIIVVSDFSLGEDDLHKVSAAGIKEENYIWIDHHKTSIARFPKMANIPGIRSTAYSGAYLAYLYCQGYTVLSNERFAKVGSEGANLEVDADKLDVPECIKLVDDFDCFKLVNGNESLCYNTAFLFFLKSIMDDDPELQHQKKLSLTLELLTRPEIKETPGKVLYADYLERGRDLVRTNAYPVRLRKFTYLNAIALNTTELGSKIFSSVYNNYEIALVYKYVPADANGTMKMSFSIYRLGQNPDKVIDVSSIAATFGGGGHAGAAGFTTNGTLPFV